METGNKIILVIGILAIGVGIYPLFTRKKANAS